MRVGGGLFIEAALESFDTKTSSSQLITPTWNRPCGQMKTARITFRGCGLSDFIVLERGQA